MPKRLYPVVQAYLFLTAYDDAKSGYFENARCGRKMRYKSLAAVPVVLLVHVVSTTYIFIPGVQRVKTSSNRVLSEEQLQTALERGLNAGGHSMVTFVDAGYVDVARNWLAVAPKEISESATLYTTDSTTFRILQPYSVLASLPNKTSQECSSFQQKWLLKHGIVVDLLSAESAIEYVTWFDVDCMFLLPYHSWLLNMTSSFSGNPKADLDLIAQMGSHPVTISDEYGVAICLGLFTARKTALRFYEEFWIMITTDVNMNHGESEYKMTCRGDDQLAFNVHASKWHAFRNYISASTSPNEGLQLSTFEPHSPHTLRLAYLPFLEFPRGMLRSDENITSFQDLKARGARVWHGNAGKNFEDKKAALMRDEVWYLTR